MNKEAAQVQRILARYIASDHSNNPNKILEYAKDLIQHLNSQLKEDIYVLMEEDNVLPLIAPVKPGYPFMRAPVMDHPPTEEEKELMISDKDNFGASLLYVNVVDK